MSHATVLTAHVDYDQGKPLIARTQAGACVSLLGYQLPLTKSNPSYSMLLPYLIHYALQVLSGCKAPNAIQLQPDEEAIGAADLQRICGRTAPQLERTRSTGGALDVISTGECFIFIL